MRRLDYMVFRNFVPVFLLALSLFTLIIELADLFSNIINYLNQNVTASQIVRVQLLYLPKCLSYALPVSLLFSVSFTLGMFYSNNELVAVFGAGIPLLRFTLPLLLVGVLLSVAGFVFQERVVIKTLQEKVDLSHSLLHIQESASNTDITVLADNGRVVYYSDYYNDATRTLNNVIILFRDENGNLTRRVDADWATWTGKIWELHRVRDFSILRAEGDVVQTTHDQLTDPALDLSPSTFSRINNKQVDQMNLGQAVTWIASLKRAGLPFRGALTSYYERFSFATTPFIVTLISAAVGGRFRKNILLMSLLVSLVLSVIYYVTQMLSGLFANIGLIQPLLGAWAAAAMFGLVGIFLFRTSRT